MAVSLKEHQKNAVNQLKTGSILRGGVGSGKSLTALVYFFEKECGGKIDDTLDVCRMTKPRDLYIITTALKRDSLDWEGECAKMALSTVRAESYCGVQVKVDSWNNINKYINVFGAFFIFDEQRLVGSGSWVKSFLKIARKNQWILLSATPGDTWKDYVAVFVANGFYKNKTEFYREHVVFNNFSNYPKIDHYIGESKLNRLKQEILVEMPYEKATVPVWETIEVSYDIKKMNVITKDRWNPYKNEPIKFVGEYYYLMRKVANSDPSRLEAIRKLLIKHQRIIIFYNFDYELEILRQLYNEPGLDVAERNGHKHNPVPTSNRWAYLVQYTSGAESWNCITTNVVVFYSQNYSYKLTHQAAGRTDRMNTPYSKLYYYKLLSTSRIDLSIQKALGEKKDFNENKSAIYFLKGENNENIRTDREFEESY